MVDEKTAGGSGGPEPGDLAALHAQHDLLQPAPATGRRLLRPVVAFLRRLLRPVLYPILERQTLYNAANARLASELRQEIRSLRDELRAQIDAVGERLQTGLDHTREAFDLQHETLAKEIRSSQHILRGELVSERHRQGQLLDAVRDALVDQIERLVSEQRRLLGAPPAAAGAGGEEARAPLRPPGPAAVADVARRSRGGELSAGGSSGPLAALATHEAARGDSAALLASLTRRLRGPEELITERLRVYLPSVRQAAAATGAPVVEIGSGRGEWLKLLRGESIRARGIDSNPLMVADCAAEGLEVAEGEGLAHLRSLPDSSCAAVVAFHVIEHLPLASVVELFHQARRVLAPGGLVIFETPNPANLVVGACNFWGDPTHVRPLPIALARALAEELGFSGVKILELHPDREHQLPEPQTRCELEVNRLFFGARDYAVLGRR